MELFFVLRYTVTNKMQVPISYLVAFYRVTHNIVLKTFENTLLLSCRVRQGSSFLHFLCPTLLWHTLHPPHTTQDVNHMELVWSQTTWWWQPKYSCGVISNHQTQIPRMYENVCRYIPLILAGLVRACLVLPQARSYWSLIYTGINGQCSSDWASWWFNSYSVPILYKDDVSSI